MPSNCLSKPMATDSAELDWRKDGELEIHTGYVRHIVLILPSVYSYTFTLIQGTITIPIM